eukprot:9167666-Karenia_brevis.AAC.1
MLDGIERLFDAGLVRPPNPTADFHRHVFRELNKQADKLAAEAHDLGNDLWCLSPVPTFKCLRGFFDGSLREGRTAGGWILYASEEADVNDSSQWFVLAKHRFTLGVDSSTAAELAAASDLHDFVSDLLRKKPT